MRARWPELLALCAGAIGVGWRLLLTWQGTPPTNSDEATLGLAAMHIAEGRDFPVFFYGQFYMGTIESFLTAPLFMVLGPSVFAQRLFTLVCYALFLWLMFALSRKLFSPGVALATVVFFAFGADRIVKNEMVGGGGYPEVNTLLAALFLIGLGLATNAYKRELLAFAGWGVMFGLIVWTHWLAAPYALAAAIALALTRRHNLPRPAITATVAGMLVGASPLLWHNLTASLKYNSVSVFLNQNAIGGDSSWWERLHGGVLIGLPLANGLCPLESCRPWHLWWGPIYLLLLVAGGLVAVRQWRRIPPDHGPDRAKYIVTVMLVAAALLSLLSYLGNPAAAETPTESARYLHYLLISTPVWIWALFRLGQGLFGRIGKVAALAIAAGLLTATTSATVALASDAGSYTTWQQEDRDLVVALKVRGVRYVYAGYWTCNRLIFASREEVICGVVTDDLRKGLNRYRPYWDAVQEQNQPIPFLVHNTTSLIGPEQALDASVRRAMTASAMRYQVIEIGPYTLYEPEPSLRPGAA